MLLCRQFYIRLRENEHLYSTFVEVDDKAGRIRAYDENTKTHYVAWRSTDVADLMKDGHLFVQQLYRICNTPTRHLVHGAVAGISGNGVLFCARGGRGKSTLTVKALIDGFDYVSDDFLSPDAADKSVEPKDEPYWGLFTGAVLMRKSLFDKVGLFDENVHTGEIIELQQKMQKLGLLMHKEDFVATKRRIHDNNFGRTSAKTEFQNYAAILRKRLLKK